MRFFTLSGSLKYKNVKSFLINWDKKERSIPQFKVKKFLQNYWFTHIVYSEFPVYGTLLKIDIFNATKKIAVEVQGRQHDQYNKFFHNNSRLNYLSSIKRDSLKRKWCEINNIKLIEIYEDEVDDLSREFFKEKFDIEL